MVSSDYKRSPISDLTGSAVIEPCPICGRYPTWKCTIGDGPYRAYVKCKPLFGKMHISAAAASPYKNESLTLALQEWNRKCEECSNGTNGKEIR